MPKNTKPATASGGHRAITVSNWKPLNRNGLRGFLTLTLPSRLVINNCQLIEVRGRQRVGLPSRRFLTAKQTVQYEPIIEFSTRKARRNFERAVLTAVEAFLRARGEL